MLDKHSFIDRTAHHRTHSLLCRYGNNLSPIRHSRTVIVPCVIIMPSCLSRLRFPTSTQHYQSNRQQTHNNSIFPTLHANSLSKFTVSTAKSYHFHDF